VSLVSLLTGIANLIELMLPALIERKLPASAALSASALAPVGLLSKARKSLSPTIKRFFSRTTRTKELIMCIIKYPSKPWRRDSVIFAVETIELAGKMVPLAYGMMTVADRRVTLSVHEQIAWGRVTAHDAAKHDDLLRALTRARTHRRLTPIDAIRGEAPMLVFELVAKVCNAVAKYDEIIVTHDVDALESLLTAVENWLDIDLPPLNVVSTAVLERAHRAKLDKRPGESAYDYYQRIKCACGELPDLRKCYRELEWNDGTMLTTDRLFPAMATHLVYQLHGGRLIGADTSASCAQLVRQARAGRKHGRNIHRHPSKQGS